MNVDTWPNLATMFFEQAATYREQPFLWKKRDGVYESLTWSDANARTVALARGLLSLGIESGDRIVLVSENRPAWPIADIAIMAAGGITTPAYTTNTPADHRHVLTDSGARGVIVSTTKLAEKIIAGARGLDHIEFIIVMEEPPTDTGGLKVLRMADVLETGQARHENVYKMAEEINRTDTACIIYTSGTGGTPKGVMLHHGAMLHNCAGAVDALDCCGVLRNREELRQSLFCSERCGGVHGGEAAAPLVRPARQRVRAVRLCARPWREPELPLRLLLRLLVARPLPRGTRLRRAAQPRNRRAAPRGRGASPHTRAAGRDDGARTGSGVRPSHLSNHTLLSRSSVSCLCFVLRNRKLYYDSGGGAGGAGRGAAASARALH